MSLSNNEIAKTIYDETCRIDSDLKRLSKLLGEFNTTKKITESDSGCLGFSIPHLCNIMTRADFLRITTKRFLKENSPIDFHSFKAVNDG